MVLHTKKPILFEQADSVEDVSRTYLFQEVEPAKALDRGKRGEASNLHAQPGPREWKPSDMTER